MKFYKVVATCLLLITFQANANLVFIKLDNASVSVGEVINVSMFASFTDAVDTIDFNFNFDNSLFSFVPNSETTALPNDGLFNIFGASTNSDGLGIGFTSLFNTVSGDFLFASFQLERTQVGNTEFSLDSITFASFATGEDFVLDPVPSVAVSVPATLGLFVLSGLGLIGLRRKI